MSMTILTLENVTDIVENRLNNNWCVMLGDIKTISTIEETVYTPNTKDALDFEMILFGLEHISFGRKTNKLKVCLGNEIKSHFESLVAVEFKACEEGIICDGMFVDFNDPYKKDLMIDELCNAIKKRYFK